MSSSAEVIPIVETKTNETKVPVVKASPWAKIQTNTDLYSLEDVMSEQLADALQEKENKKSQKNIDSGLNNEFIDTGLAQASASAFADIDIAKLSENPSEENDLILAQLLQLEFDKEADLALKQREEQRNKNSRVAISYSNFKTIHPVNDKDENEINLKYEDDISSSSESEDEITKITFKRGVHGKGENMISKHDLILSGRHNASKVVNFPPEFETGDSHGIDMRLSNKVFNTLKMHSIHEQKRNNRINDKTDKSTNVISLDPKTKLILFKLVNADILESIGGVISTGKEATIFHAVGGKSQEILIPKECVVKVYKTTLNEFKTREKYIGDDYRFNYRFKHLNPRKIVKLWAEKEMYNLMKMKRYEIPCPDVVILKKHVLLMSLIGKDNVPAPKLKDADLNEAELESAYKQCIQLVKDLYNRCNLVHADFNQFNLLWFENRVWVIDVSQSVEPIHPLGYEFLLRDCQNIYKYFTNRKLPNVLTGEEIFNQVTNMNFKGEGEYFLSQIQKYTKDKQMELKASSNKEDDKPYNFDYYFEKSLKKKQGLVEDEDKESSEDEE